jgi:hypothetical protein
MKKILIVLVAAHFSALVAQGQSESIANLPLTRVESLQTSLLQVEPQRHVPSRILPDDPIPVLPSLQDGPAPCPFGEGKSCAILGGRAYFSDPIHMTEHDATWAKAARNPAMLVGYALNLAATVADIEATQSCLRVHTCTEGNPLAGSNPSRARSYGTAIPLDLAAYAAFAFVKKRGQGNLAFGLLWGSTVSHIYFASAGFSYAHLAAATSTSSAKRR